MAKENEIVLFETEDKEITLNVKVNQDTVWLNRNNALFRDGHKVISDGALVAITLMIAESDPKEKDIMTTMVMNLLSVG